MGPPASARATASRSRTRSGPTSSSGRPTRGAGGRRARDPARRHGLRAAAGDDARVRRDRAAVHAELRAAPRQGGGGARPRSTRSPGRAGRLHGRAGRVDAGRARADRDPRGARAASTTRARRRSARSPTRARTHGGLHLFEDEYVCEVLDPATGEPVPDGRDGRAGHDRAEPHRLPGDPLPHRRHDRRSSAPCPAGHPGMWLPQGILGRVDDMVVIRGMNVFPSAIEAILRRSGGVGEFSITFYNDPHAMDEVKVEVELENARDARDIQARLRQTLGLRVRIVPVKPGILPTYSGKARRVLDLRPAAPGGAVTRVAAGEPALRRSASEEVAEAIRASMFAAALQPGDRLGREEDLAQRFGVSRPTLREALRLLSSAHLIRATKGPGGGIFVAATPEQGIGLSVTDSVASMLSAASIDLDELIETRMLLRSRSPGWPRSGRPRRTSRGCTRSSTRPGRSRPATLPRARHAAARVDRRDRRQPARARVHRVDRRGAAAAAARADRAGGGGRGDPPSSTATSCARSSAATRSRPSARCASTSSTCTTSSARSGARPRATGGAVSALFAPLFAPARLREALSRSRVGRADARGGGGARGGRGRGGRDPRRVGRGDRGRVRPGAADVAGLGEASLGAGNPVVPLVERAARGRRRGRAPADVHRGATSQDVLDTAAMLVARRALALVDRGARRRRARLRRPGPRARRHADGRPDAAPAGAAGHVRAQGGRLARRDARRPRRAGPRAASTCSSAARPARSPRSARTARAWPRRSPEQLGLGAPDAAVAHRARPGRRAGRGARGRGRRDGQARRSTSCCSRRPRWARSRRAPAGPRRCRTSATRSARCGRARARERVPPLAALLLGAMAQEHERAAGAWHAEWEPLAQSLRLTGGAAAGVREALDGLEVRRGPHAREPRPTGGLLMASASCSRSRRALRARRRRTDARPGRSRRAGAAARVPRRAARPARGRRAPRRRGARRAARPRGLPRRDATLIDRALAARERELRMTDLAHRVDGPPDAPALVLGNSLGTRLAIWDALVPRSRALPRRPLRPARARASPVPRRYTFEDLGADVLALLDRLGDRARGFGGVSLGGMVGMSLAAAAPDRIDRLVLCCTSARLGPPELWQRAPPPCARTARRRWPRRAVALVHARRRPRPRRAASTRCSRAARRGLRGVLRGDRRHGPARRAAGSPRRRSSSAAATTTPRRRSTPPIADGIPGARLVVLPTPPTSPRRAARGGRRG